MIKLSGVSDLQGGQSPRFPIDFAGHRYNSAALQPVIQIQAAYIPGYRYTVCDLFLAALVVLSIYSNSELMTPRHHRRTPYGATVSVKYLHVFTARCTLVQSAVLRSHVVCLSVCNVGEL